MQIPTRKLTSGPAPILLAIALALALSGCSGGPRPTITTDRIEDIELPTADADPLPTATPSSSSDDAGTAPTTDGSTADGSAPAGTVERLVVEVLETFPHDPTAFTQGLELHDGFFLESTGLYGESDLRRVIPGTGEVVQVVEIAPEFFAEGLTKVADELIQLTWRENTAFYWDATSFELLREVAYPGEGWGLCHDGARLVMTDGTPVLIFRDPVSFDEVGRVAVTLDGQEVANLNEVECVGGDVWANIWLTDLIVRIDPTTGNVTGVVDAAALERPGDADGAVLNGIAWDETTQSFYVTGKLWPTMYRVNFVPAATG